MARLRSHAVWVACLGLTLLSAAASEAGPAVTLQREGPSRVARYARVDFTVHLDRGYANPFDPRQVEVALEITAPSGKQLLLPAFWYQQYERQRHPRNGRDQEWLYPVGEPGWRARFAPAEAGRYECRAHVTDARGTASSDPTTFECVPSQGKGFVRVSGRDPRFLEFGDGTPFFAIGQNVAFVSPTQYVDTYKADGIFERMATNGANYARVWACCEDWAMALEARKSGWSRSWGWGPVLGLTPGPEGYHSGSLSVALPVEAGRAAMCVPSEDVALRPNTHYVLSGRVKTNGKAAFQVEVFGAPLGEAIGGENGGWTEFRREFATGPDQWWLGNVAFCLTAGGHVWLRGLSLKEASGGPELLWEADPEQSGRGRYNLPDAFMLDQVVEAAERHGIYLQLVLLTRDHYMGSPQDYVAGPLADPDSAAYQAAIADAQRLLRYAVARWGYSTHVAAWEYFNEMNPDLPTDRFYREVGQYLAQADIYHHLRATSAWGPAPKDWEQPQLDQADLHWYLRPAWGELSKDEVEAVLDRAALLRQHAAAKPALLSEFGLANDEWGLSAYTTEDTEWVHLHNCLWASALSGLSGTASFWWWEALDQGNAYPQYAPVAAFVAGIPFTTAGLRPFDTYTSGRKARVVGLQGADRAYVWIRNQEATWWNIVVEKHSPAEVKGESLRLTGLRPGSYRVEWWDTRHGRVSSRETAAVTGDTLDLSIARFTRDVAVKVIKQKGPRAPPGA